MSEAPKHEGYTDDSLAPERGSASGLESAVSTSGRVGKLRPDATPEERAAWTRAMHEAKAAAKAAAKAEQAGKTAKPVAEPLGRQASALDVLEAIASDKKMPAAARVAAARGLADIDSKADIEIPTSVAQIQALSDSDLYRLASRLERSAPIPEDVAQFLDD